MKVHKQTLSYITPEEYLEYERSCEYKHEFAIESINCEILVEEVYEKIEIQIKNS